MCVRVYLDVAGLSNGATDEERRCLAAIFKEDLCGIPSARAARQYVPQPACPSCPLLFPLQHNVRLLIPYNLEVARIPLADFDKASTWMESSVACTIARFAH